MSLPCWCGVRYNGERRSMYFPCNGASLSCVRSSVSGSGSGHGYPRQEKCVKTAVSLVLNTVVLCTEGAIVVNIPGHFPRMLCVG